MTVTSPIRCLSITFFVLFLGACSPNDLNGKSKSKNSEIEIQGDWSLALYSTPNSLEDDLTSSNSNFFILEDLDANKSDLSLIQQLKLLCALLLLNGIVLGINWARKLRANRHFFFYPQALKKFWYTHNNSTNESFYNLQ